MAHHCEPKCSRFSWPRRAGPALGVWVWLGFAGGSCAETTQLRVNIEGDFQVPDDIERLVVEFRGSELTFQTSHELRSPSRPLREALILYPGSRLSGSVQIRVRGQHAERTVAAAMQDAAFTRNRSVAVQLRLEPRDEEPASADDEEENSNPFLLTAQPVRWLDESDDAP